MGRLIESGNSEIQRALWDRRFAEAQRQAQAKGTSVLTALWQQPWANGGAEAPAPANASGRDASLWSGLKSFGEGLIGLDVGQLANASSEQQWDFARGAALGALGGISDAAAYAASSQIPRPPPAPAASRSYGGAAPFIGLSPGQSIIAQILSRVGSGRGGSVPFR